MSRICFPIRMPLCRQTILWSLGREFSVAPTDPVAIVAPPRLIYREICSMLPKGNTRRGGRQRILARGFLII